MVTVDKWGTMSPNEDAAGPAPGHDNAVDEDGEADGDFVALQKSLSHKKRAAKGCSDARIHKAMPFPFLPNIRPLTVSDLDSVVALENAAFTNPEFRASPEKVPAVPPPHPNYLSTNPAECTFLSVHPPLTLCPQLRYRLTTCPELSLGVFCTATPAQTAGWQMETLAAAKPVETSRADKAVSVLLAHVLSTRCCGNFITDPDMDYPRDWEDLRGKSVDVGHQDTGRTVALHSLAVSPKLQGCGIGKMIVKAYLQQMNNSGLADRVSLLCQDVSQSHT